MLILTIVIGLDLYNLYFIQYLLRMTNLKSSEKLPIWVLLLTSINTNVNKSTYRCFILIARTSCWQVHLSWILSTVPFKYLLNGELRLLYLQPHWKSPFVFCFFWRFITFLSPFPKDSALSGSFLKLIVRLFPTALALGLESCAVFPQITIFYFPTVTCGRTEKENNNSFLCSFHFTHNFHSFQKYNYSISTNHISMYSELIFIFFL